MEFFALFALFLVGSIVFSFFSSKKAVKTRRDFLEKTFGQAPSFRTDMESVDAYWHQFVADHKDLVMVDDITWNDLDMDEVFHRINTCQTSVGEETLYKTLRVMGDVPKNFEAWLTALRRNKEERLNVQSYLSQLGKAPFNGLATFLSGVTRVSTPSHTVLTLMGILPIMALISMLFIGYAGLLVFIASAAVNLGYAVYFKVKVASSLSAVRYMSSMLWCTGKLSSLKIEGLEDLLGEIRQLNQLFKPIKSRFSAIATESMASNPLEMMGEFARMFFLSDLRGYSKSANLILKNKDKAFELYDKVGHLDMLIAVCSFRKSLGAVCAPTFHEGMTLSMERMGHPLLTRPVENSCTIKRDTLITGSNASGKSTFIKAVAINALLGQTIHTCAAKSFALPRAQIISSMALKDSIVKGDSYFVAEIKSLRRIMEASRARPCLCFVDEILRGTNTVERIAASSAVLYSLSRENCLCLVASHDIELTRILENEFDNCHFEEAVTDKGVTFDYTLKEGPSNTRNAIVLLSTMGFDQSIIAKANELVNTFEGTNTWPAFTDSEEDHAAPEA